MKVKRLFKHKRKVTIDDFLNSDVLSHMLDSVYEERHDIEELIIIHTSSVHEGIAMETNGVDADRLIGMLEALKFAILKGDFDG